MFITTIFNVFSWVSAGRRALNAEDDDDPHGEDSEKPDSGGDKRIIYAISPFT